MASAPLLTEEELDTLRQFDTCMIANAIEKFNVRLRNTGFTNGKVRCMFPDAPPLVGYAITGRLRSGDPPIAGPFFRDRGDLWTRILETPAPRVLVLEDIDERPGHGAFIGDMHAAILNALGCVGYVTNVLSGSCRQSAKLAFNCLPAVSRFHTRTLTFLTSELRSPLTGWRSEPAPFCMAISTEWSPYLTRLPERSRMLRRNSKARSKR